MTQGDPRWECYRKKVYDHQRFAEKVASGLQQRNGVPMHAYGCPHCGSWHVGRLSSKNVSA